MNKVHRPYPREDIPVLKFYIIEMVGMVEGIVVDMNHRREPLPIEGLARLSSSCTSGIIVSLVEQLISFITRYNYTSSIYIIQPVIRDLENVEVD